MRVSQSARRHRPAAAAEAVPELLLLQPAGDDQVMKRLVVLAGIKYAIVFGWEIGGQKEKGRSLKRKKEKKAGLKAGVINNIKNRDFGKIEILDF